MLRPRIVLTLACPASPSRRPRRSAPTCSSGSPQQHDVALLLTRPDKPPRPRPQAARRRRRRRSPSGSASRSRSRLGSTTTSRSRPTPSSSRRTACSSRESLLERALWLNVHPSLLPRWRGAAPVERALMAGDDAHRRHDPPHDRGARRRPDRGAGGIRRSGPRTMPAPSSRARRRSRRGCSTACSPTRSSRRSPTTASRTRRRSRPTTASSTSPARRESSSTASARSRRTSARARSSTGGRCIVWKARVADDGGLELLEVQPEGGQAHAYDEYLRGLR